VKSYLANKLSDDRYKLTLCYVTFQLKVAKLYLFYEKRERVMIMYLFIIYICFEDGLCIRSRVQCDHLKIRLLYMLCPVSKHD